MAEKDQFMIFVMHEDEERDTSLCSMNMRLPFCNQVNWTAFLRREVEGRECKQSSAELTGAALIQRTANHIFH